MLRNFDSLRGLSLAAADGEIGKIREMYFDDEHWVLRYLVVTAGSWLTGRELLIGAQALGQVDAQAGAVEVQLSREEVRQAPAADTEKPVSRRFEERYFQHHGWIPYWMGAAPIVGTGIPLPTQVLKRGTGTDQETEREEDESQPGEETEQETDPHLRSSQSVKALAIQAQDGLIGSVADYVIDDSGWSIPYIVIDTSKWWSSKYVLLGTRWIEKIREPGGAVYVNRTCSTIKEAPAYDPSMVIDRAYERRLHEHYGFRAYWESVG